MRFDQTGRVSSLIHVLFDEPGESFRAVRLERHPDFQRAKTARKLYPAIGEGKAS